MLSGIAQILRQLYEVPSMKCQVSRKLYNIKIYEMSEVYVVCIMVVHKITW